MFTCRFGWTGGVLQPSASISQPSASQQGTNPWQQAFPASEVGWCFQYSAESVLALKSA